MIMWYPSLYPLISLFAKSILTDIKMDMHASFLGPLLGICFSILIFFFGEDILDVRMCFFIAAEGWIIFANPIFVGDLNSVCWFLLFSYGGVGLFTFFYLPTWIFNFLWFPGFGYLLLDEIFSLASIYRARCVGRSFFFNITFLLIIWESHIIYPNHIHFQNLTNPQKKWRRKKNKTK